MHLHDILPVPRGDFLKGCELCSTLRLHPRVPATHQFLSQFLYELPRIRITFSLRPESPQHDLLTLQPSFGWVECVEVNVKLPPFMVRGRCPFLYRYEARFRVKRFFFVHCYIFLQWMMRHIRVPRPSFVRVNPVDKSKNRLYKAVPVDFSRDYCPTLRKIHLILLNSRIFYMV